MHGDKIKEQEILDGDWDHLIILDACRYDSFEKEYQKYLTGKLEKRKSRGACTAEWLSRTFTKKMDDVTYISGNAFINNKNVPLNRSTKDCNSKWNPTSHFKKVVDVWLTDWDDTIGTVHPDKINQAVLKNTNEPRMIIHYIQPHEPYLNYQKKAKEWTSRDRIENKKKNKIKNCAMAMMKPILLPIWHRLSFKTKIKIKKKLGMNLGVFEDFYITNKVPELKGYYEDNLNIVLKSVAELIENLDGKIIITADHGEAFGEKGDWGHKYISKNPVLREVPWLIIQKEKKLFELKNIKI